VNQGLLALNRAIRETCESCDDEAIFAIVRETLEQIGLKSIFVSLSDDHGKMTIQSIYPRHSTVLTALEKLLRVKLVGLSLPLEAASMLEAAAKDGKTIFVKGPKEILRKMSPSSSTSL